MLVLSRKSGEVLWVGGAKLEFQLKGKVVRVCVEAPQEIRILRGEIKDDSVASNDLDLDGV